VHLCGTNSEELFSFNFQAREEMNSLEKYIPFVFIAGQILVFFQVEHFEVQLLMLAFIAFQVWRRYKKQAVN